MNLTWVFIFIVFPCLVQGALGYSYARKPKAGHLGAVIRAFLFSHLTAWSSGAAGHGGWVIYPAWLNVYEQLSKKGTIFLNQGDPAIILLPGLPLLCFLVVFYFRRYISIDYFNEK